MIPLGKYVFKDKDSLLVFFERVWEEEYDEYPSDSSGNALGGYEFSERQEKFVMDVSKKDGVLLTFDLSAIEAVQNDEGTIDLAFLIVPRISDHPYRTIAVSEESLPALMRDEWLVQPDLKQLTFDNAAVGMFITTVGSSADVNKLRRITEISEGNIITCSNTVIKTTSQVSYWRILEQDEIKPLYDEHKEILDGDSHPTYEKWVENQRKAINDTLDKHYGVKETTQEINTMPKLKTVATAAVTANKSAGLEAAKLKVGKTANNVAAKMIKPKLPIGTKGFADHPMFKVVLANLASIAVQQMAGSNTKALAIAEAMMTSAYFELVDQFDIESMIEEMTGQFTGSTVDKIVEAKSQEIVIDD